MSEKKKVTRAEILKRFEELGIKIKPSSDSNVNRVYMTFAKKPSNTKKKLPEMD